jgi:hypothetical protein
MQKRLASLLCTNRRENSFDSKFFSFDNDDETETQTVQKTNERRRLIAQSGETIRNHRKIKRSTNFIRTFRAFYQRISNGFRRKFRTAYPTVQHEIGLDHWEIHEDIYTTIPWEFTNNRHTEFTEEITDYCMIRTIKSPPEITWKHSWTTSETRDALLNSQFSNIPNEIYLQIFQFLSIRDLGNVSLVCRQFKMIADDDEIWKSKCNSKLIFDLLLSLTIVLMYK